MSTHHPLPPTWLLFTLGEEEPGGNPRACTFLKPGIGHSKALGVTPRMQLRKGLGLTPSFSPLTESPLQSPEGVNISPATPFFHLKDPQKAFPEAQLTRGPRLSVGRGALAPRQPLLTCAAPPQGVCPDSPRPLADPDTLISPQTAKHR